MPRAAVTRKPGRGGGKAGSNTAPTGVPLLDYLLGGGAAKGSITYLVGTPGSGRALLCSSFLVEGHSSVLGSANSMEMVAPAALSGFLAEGISAGSLHLVDVNPDVDAEWFQQMELFLRESEITRLVLWGADLLELSQGAAVLARLCSVLRKLGVTSLFAGTVGSYGSDVQIPTPLLLAYCDNVILTQKRLDSADGSRLATVLKSIAAAAAAADVPPVRYSVECGRAELLETISPPKSASASKTKQRFTVIPELYYLSPSHENLVKRRLALVNATLEHSTFELPAQRFANGVQYNSHIEEFRKGQVPWDLFISDIYRLRELIDADLIQPLDSFLPPNWEDRYLPIALEQCRIQGHVWALPHWINIGVLVYRQDLLKKHGLTVPRTWDELVAQSARIVRAERNPKLIGYGFQGAQVEALTCNFLEFLWGNRGSIYDSSLHIMVNSASAIEALQFMCDLVYKHGVSAENTPTTTEAQSQQMFLEHRLVFTRSWPLFLSQIPSGFSDPYKNVSIAPLPTFSRDIAPRGVIGGFCYVVGKHVRTPEVLVDFHRQFYDEAMVTRSAAEGWMCSPFRDPYERAEVLRTRPFLKSIPQLLETGSSRGAIPHYAKLTELVRREVNFALRQVKSPKEALDAAAEELHKHIFRHFREQRLVQAVEYVERNLQLELSRDQAASACHLSPSYFSAVFSEAFGCSFTRYVSEKRVEKAKEMLERSALTISEIGQNVGFKDQSYFCQVFRQFTNMTPTEYRLNAMTKVFHH